MALAAARTAARAGGGSSLIAAAIARCRRRADAFMMRCPSGVASTIVIRPLSGCVERRAYPWATSPSTILLIVGLATSSTFASRPSGIAPPNTRTDSALRRALVRPDARSMARSPRKRWMAPAFRCCAAASS